ncbi:hypothetical protein B0J12DRAFT_732608 [Macrophomina phaseolina]|uniref:Uncharacterized protein n=1 Tax=Macrophomina phaseolina TaxID=35725 RepID=A0ABQ8FVZ4_9PEZI|nr:hypothetical protein B0J12DRAFT_732608 [Macrophomina phaseolina]
MALPNRPPGSARSPVEEAPFELYLSNQEYPRDDPRVLFELYLCWCMNGVIYSKGDRKDKAEASRRAEHNLLLASYFYGAKKGDTSFQDAVIDAITEQFTRHPHLLLDKDYADRVYDRTGRGDKLRRLLVMIITSRLGWSPLQGLLESAKPDEFHQDLVAVALPLSDNEREEFGWTDGDLLSEEKRMGETIPVGG